MEMGDVNLEFAHVSFACDEFNHEQVTRSARLALKLLNRYRQEGLACSMSILIDDKHVRKRLTTAEVRPFLRIASRHVRQIDYICFEKRLPRYKNHLLRQIRPEKRAHVAEEMLRYRKRHGRIGCSHDIAIWHLMRLGLIQGADVGTVVPVGALQAASPPFVARRAVSVLCASDKEPEDRAIHDILRHCIDDGVLGRIERIYF